MNGLIFILMILLIPLVLRISFIVLSQILKVLDLEEMAYIFSKTWYDSIVVISTAIAIIIIFVKFSGVI